MYLGSKTSSIPFPFLLSLSVGSIVKPCSVLQEEEEEQGSGSGLGSPHMH